MKLIEAEKSSTTRVLLTGLSGSGKSTLASKLAEKFHLIWISLDNDIDALLKLPEEWKHNVDVYNIPDSATFPIASQTLLHLFKTLKGTICTSHGNFNCAICKTKNGVMDPIDLTDLDPTKDIVVIDTATQLGHSILFHVTKDKPVDYKPQFDDWGGLRKYTEYFCTQFQAARFNLVVLCHVIETQLEDDRVKLVPNFGSKGMSAEFAKAFSHVIYCEVVNKKHKAFSSSTASNSVLTKSRTDFKIESLDEPSLIPIFDKPKSTLEFAEQHNSTTQSTQQTQLVESKPANTNAISALDKLKAQKLLGAK